MPVCFININLLMKNMPIMYKYQLQYCAKVIYNTLLPRSETFLLSVGVEQ